MGLDQITNINFFEQDGSIITPPFEGIDRDFYIFLTDFSLDGTEDVVKVGSLAEFQEKFGDVVSPKMREILNTAFSAGWGVIFKRITLPNAQKASAFFNKVIQRFDSSVQATEVYKFDPTTRSFTPVNWASEGITLNDFSNNQTHIIVVDNINLSLNNFYTWSSQNPNDDTIVNRINKGIFNTLKNENAVLRVLQVSGNNFRLNLYVLAPSVNLTTPNPVNVTKTVNTIPGGYVPANTKYRFAIRTQTDQEIVATTEDNVGTSGSIVRLQNTTNYPGIHSYVIYKIKPNNQAERLILSVPDFVDYGAGFTNLGQGENISHTKLLPSNVSVVANIYTQPGGIQDGKYKYVIYFETSSGNVLQRTKQLQILNSSNSPYSDNIINLTNNNDNYVDFTVNNLPSGFSKAVVWRIKLDNNDNIVAVYKKEYALANYTGSVSLNQGSASSWVDVSAQVPLNVGVGYISTFIPDYREFGMAGLSATSESGGELGVGSYEYIVVPYAKFTYTQNNNTYTQTHFAEAVRRSNIVVESNGSRVRLVWNVPQNVDFWGASNLQNVVVERGFYIYKKIGESANYKRIIISNNTLTDFIDYGDVVWTPVSVVPTTNINYLTYVLIPQGASLDPNNTYFVKVGNVTNLDQDGNPMVVRIGFNTVNKTSRFNGTRVYFKTVYDKITRVYSISFIKHTGTEYRILEARKNGGAWTFTFIPKNLTVEYSSPSWGSFVEEVLYYINNNALNYEISADDLSFAFDYFVFSDGRLNLFGGRSRVSEEVSTPTKHESQSIAEFAGGGSGIPLNTTENNLFNETLNIYTQNSNAILNYVRTELNKTNLYRNLFLIYLPYANTPLFWDNTNHPTYKFKFASVFNGFRNLAEGRGDLALIVDTPPVSDYAQLEVFDNIIGSPNSSYVAIYTPSVIRGNRRVSVGLEVVKKIITLVNANASSLAPYGIANNGVIEADNVEKTFLSSEYDKIYNILQYNPVIDFGSDGIQIRGLRTLYKAVSVLQNLHTRLVASIIKKRLYRIALRYQGTQLNAQTIASIITEVSVYLSTLVEKGQVDSFEPVRNLSTMADILQGTLKLQVGVRFTKQLERVDFYITFQNAEITVS